MTIEEINEAIKTVDANKVSDGYHTFGELYDHRITLFIMLCNLIYRSNGSFTERNFPWKSKLHSDGTSWEGWFVAGIGREKGYQITYHLPIDRWDELNVTALDKAPEWDGHTPNDVLERIKHL